MDFVQIKELCIRTFTFLPTDGSQRECFNIALVDDAVYESTEYFIVDLHVLDASMINDIRINPSITEIFILDNDGENAHFGLYYVYRSDATRTFNRGM